MKADLAGIEGSVAEIANSINSQDYFGATDKAKAISAKAPTSAPRSRPPSTRPPRAGRRSKRQFEKRLGRTSIESTVDPLLRVVRGALRRAPWGLLLFSLAGCARSEPFEASLADLQERKLWRAEIENFAPDEYREYRSQLRRAKDALIETERKFVWFRDYDALTLQFKRVLARGDELHGLIAERRDQQKSGIEERLETQRDKIDRLDILTTLISVGRSSREFLAKAELLTNEARSSPDGGGTRMPRSGSSARRPSCRSPGRSSRPRSSGSSTRSRSATGGAGWTKRSANRRCVAATRSWSARSTANCTSTSPGGS